MERLVISAPFGHWFEFPHATRTLGTYTRECRAGFWKRWWRVLATLRPVPFVGGAWRNRLGLPNPGFADLVRRAVHGDLVVSDKIISITARNTADWLFLVENAAALGPRAVEMNVSCPNTPGEVDGTDYPEVFKRAAAQKCRFIVKLPPVDYQGRLFAALGAGITAFHCCNTLPTPAGGLSGKPLKSLSLSCVREVSACVPHDDKLVIGGGGVTTLDDARDYLRAGATHVGVASGLIWPWNRGEIRRLAVTLHRLFTPSGLPMTYALPDRVPAVTCPRCKTETVPVPTPHADQKGQLQCRECFLTFPDPSKSLT